MNPSQGFEINLNETFPSLKAAPSIESIIYWQAPPTVKLSAEPLKTKLNQRLPEYPICQPQQNIDVELPGTANGGMDFLHRTRWNGFRLKDKSTRYVAQFTPTGVVFSRLEPYETWDSFSAEAIKFWRIFLDLAKPVEIQRLGVRDINRISIQEGEDLSAYLKSVPPSLPGMEFPTKAFFHQDQYQVPGYPYTITWVQTVQTNASISIQGKAIIVDIDVFTGDLVNLDENNLIQHLLKMRWLKNKVFFNCMTPNALKKFEG